MHPHAPTQLKEYTLAHARTHKIEHTHIQTGHPHMHTHDCMVTHNKVLHNKLKTNLYKWILILKRDTLFSYNV